MSLELRLRAQFAIYPLELIRTRLAVCPSGHYRGIVHCFTRVLQEEGHRAFYRGLTPSLVRAGPWVLLRSFGCGVWTK